LLGRISQYDYEKEYQNMEFLPEFRLGWLNGWLLLALLVLTDGILFLVFRKDVVNRLFDRSGWTRQQKVLTFIGKLLALTVVIMIILTPLKIGSSIFILGLGIVAVGLVALVKALFDFRNSPANLPATEGVYRITRHPQNIASSIVILGCTIAIGSWLAMIVFILARVFLHANLVAEEEACVRVYGQVYRDYMARVPRYLFF
jgi:protein-S-isoprenylcysteine O-methyltransferase Ste14